MSTRRAQAAQKTLEERDDGAKRASDASAASPEIAAAVPASVIIKLLGFTLAMIAGPIATYYLTLDFVFKGNSTFAGALAAIIANVVLIAYVVVAMKEDQSDRLAEMEKKSI